MKILIADDSDTNLIILSSALKKLGHEVITASSGKEAIKKFREIRPDLIILDVMMDDIDGFECAKTIREIDNEDWIPIIFLSASTDDESIEKGIDAGGDDYLTKPFSKIILAAKIKAMQRISDMRQKLFETTQKLYFLSSTDALTGVYNRHYFNRILNEILSSVGKHDRIISLLFVDLDNFKNINDGFGHHIGDLFLIEVTKRLKTCLKSNDFIARLGGDEFAIILTDINKHEEAGEIAKKIVNTLSLDYVIDDHHIRGGASVGIAFYPQSAITADDLILNADVAMYHAKSLGRNNYQYFTEEINEKYKTQLSLEHELKFSLEKKELYLTYQPIFDLCTKNVIGVETLVCWNHPKLGLVSPSIFMRIAEETGLTWDIGNWILRNTCQQVSLWPLDKIKNFKFTINISLRQLTHENFLQQVVTVLNDTGVSPNHLELELSEAVVMTCMTNSFKEMIDKLHDLEIGISINDFGAGYSSLIRLKKLPIKTLKIKNSFIHEAVSTESGAIIVNCLIALGKNLGLNIIAEGIESEEQLKFLVSIGCPQGQGYYLSKPISAEEVRILLEKFYHNRIESIP